MREHVGIYVDACVCFHTDQAMRQAFGLDLSASRSVVHVNTESMSRNVYDLNNSGNAIANNLAVSSCPSVLIEFVGVFLGVSFEVYSVCAQELDNTVLMQRMLCTEASVQEAMGQVQKQMHESHITMTGGGGTQIWSGERQQWFEKLARDSIVYLKCFGFVPVKMVKTPGEGGEIVPVVVPLSQIEWDFDADIDSLFACPRVTFKDVSSNKQQAHARPRIYVYAVQDHTIDLCKLGPMCSVLESYRQLLNAREYNTRCNSENLKHVAYIESRPREREQKDIKNVDMSSVLEHTMRALPRDTSEKHQHLDHDSHDVERKRDVIYSQMSEDQAASSQNTAYVLPMDTTVRNIQTLIPQIDLRPYTAEFEQCVYMAMGVQNNNNGLQRTSREGDRQQNPPGGQEVDNHLSGGIPTVFICELENVISIFASAISDKDFVKKIEKYEASEKEKTLHSNNQGKRKRGRKSARSGDRVESINIQSLGVDGIVKCKIQPHICNSMQTAIQLYNEHIITPESFGVYLEKATGFKFANIARPSLVKPTSGSS